MFLQRCFSKLLLRFGAFSVRSERRRGAQRVSGKAVWRWTPVVAVDGGPMQIQWWEGAALSRAETVLQGTTQDDHFVRDRGPEHVVISKDKIHTLIVDFDQADFFNLEDRAFAWGFHTSGVGVKITIDGKTKEVWSDAYHIGSKSGLQARFVEAADAIDKAVGTDQWVKCDEGRCGN